MARIDKKTISDDFMRELSEEHKTTINKMIEISNIFKNPPCDNRFNKNEISYITAYFNIMDEIQKDDADYNELYVQTAINKLYDKIFKHRRY